MAKTTNHDTMLDECPRLSLKIGELELDLEGMSMSDTLGVLRAVAAVLSEHGVLEGGRLIARAGGRVHFGSRQIH